MRISQIVSIAGQPGLFKAKTYMKIGLMVETLDEKRVQSFKPIAHNKISSLGDTSIYTTNEDETVPLVALFVGIHADGKYKNGVPKEVVSDKATLRALIAEKLPNYDPAKLRDHDIKKIINWYNIILEFMPEALVME